MRKPKLSKKSIEDIQITLAGCKPGKETKNKVLDLADKYNLSVPQIYRYSKAYRVNGRKKRMDAGKSKKRLNEQQTRIILKLCKEGYSTPKAIEIAEVNKIIPRDNISIDWLNRQRREHGYSMKMLKMDLTPHRRFEAKYPNLIHQFDATVAQAFYRNDDGSIGFEGPTKRYKNKPGNRLPRLILFLLVDDHSRAKYAEFVRAESSINALLFLERAWRKKEDQQRFPFYGIPRFLYCDKGPINKSRKFLQAMETLDITVIHHRTEKPTATGKVERGMQTIQRDFEIATKFTRFENIDHINAHLYDWLIGHNMKVCSSTSEQPFYRWLNISANQLKNVPDEELMRVLHYENGERQIKSDLSFSVENIRFQLPWKKPFINWVAKKIEAYWYPGDLSKVIIACDNKEYEIHASNAAEEENDSLRFVLPPKSARDEMDEKLDAINLSKFRLTGYSDELYGQDFIPRTAQKFPKDKIKPFLAEPGLDYLEASRWLRKERIFHTPLDVEEVTLLQKIFAGRERVTEEEILAEIAQWQKPHLEIVQEA